MIFEANVAICETATQHMLSDFDKTRWTRSSSIATYMKREFLYMSRDLSKNDKIDQDTNIFAATLPFKERFAI